MLEVRYLSADLRLLESWHQKLILSPFLSCHPFPIVLKLSFPKNLFLEIFDCTKNNDIIIPKIFDMFDFAKNGTIPEPVMRKILSRKFAQEVIIYYLYNEYYT